MSKRQQNTIISRLRTLSVLFVYACFFVTQQSFDYSICSQTYAAYVQANAKSSPKASIKQLDKRNDKKANISLNKRFQPESFLVSEVPVSISPVQFIIAKPVFCYTNPTLSFSYLSVGYLRGPPAIHYFTA